MSVVIEEFKPVLKNARAVLRECASGLAWSCMRLASTFSCGRAWPPPPRPIMDRDGGVMRNQDGKTRRPPIALCCNNVCNNSSAQIVNAVHAACPDAPIGAPDAVA
jgi:hypothetical protein